MFKFLICLCKKLIVGLLLIYAYNVIVYPISVTIPINVFTILFVTFLGFPGIIGLSLFSLLIV